MARDCKIILGECEFIVTKQEVKKLKSILDKLQVHYILDHVSFHNTVSAVELMKEVHKVEVWKVEKDGSVSLNNRFGHSGRFKCQYIYIPGLLEVAIVDWDILSVEEVDFLDQLICRYERMPILQHQNNAPYSMNPLLVNLQDNLTQHRN